MFDMDRITTSTIKAISLSYMFTDYMMHTVPVWSTLYFVLDPARTTNRIILPHGCRPAKY